MIQSLSRFTIITSVYKGSKFLPLLFESLLEQYKSYRNFEWILVDDYSNDFGVTKDEIDKILEARPPFSVKAIYLERNNYGSLSTFTGSEHADGEYIIILDQDDFLAPQGLQVFNNYINQYSHRPGFVGVCGRCLNSKGELIGNKFNKNEIYSNELDVRLVMKIKGEMFQCTKTEIVREYFEGMLPGYTNGWAWARISLKYKWLYTNDIVRLYNTENPTSHTNSSIVHYHMNWCIGQICLLNAIKPYVLSAPLFYLKTLLAITRGFVICGQAKQILMQSLFIRIQLIAALPFGAILALVAILRKNRIYLPDS